MTSPLEDVVNLLHRAAHRHGTMELPNRALAGAIAALFVLLGSAYSILCPIFESSDELSHYPYAKHMADGQGLPIQRPGQVALWEQEGSQPPLYYAMAALLTRWIDTSDLARIRRTNPHASIGVPLAQDNRNMIIHTTGEDWPWRGTVLAVHLIRFFSVLLCAGTTVCTYYLGRELFPSRPSLALYAMGLNASIPMFLFIGASVNNDNLVVLLCSLSLLLLVRHVRHGTSAWTQVGLGFLLGAACLTKLSALALLPLAALGLALRQMTDALGAKVAEGGAAGPGRLPGRLAQSRELLAWLKDCAMVFVPVLLVAGWWYWRNWQLYGDPLGLRPMLDIVGRREGVSSLGATWGEFRGFRISFWGLFGAVNVLMRPQWVYHLLDGFTLVALFGLLWGLWQRRCAVFQLFGRRQFQVLPLLLLPTWIVLEALSLLRWTSMTMASQGRLLFPAISALCVLFGWGFLNAASLMRPHRLGRWLALVPLIALLPLAISSPFAAIRPAYARPAPLTPADIPSTAQPHNVTYGGVMRLLATTVEETVARPGDDITVTLYWQSLAPMQKDYSLYIHLFGLGGQPLGQRDSYPGGGMMPTSLWPTGQVIRDRYRVPIRADAAGPVALEVEVGVYELHNMQLLRAVDERGRQVGRPIIGRIRLAVPTQPPSPAQVADYSLGDRVRLVGYDLGSTSATAGTDVPLTLYWQVTGKMDRDYTVFAHLVGEGETIVGQGDGPPLSNAYPTSFWTPGEYLVDVHSLVIRQDAPVGRHQLYVGLYDRQTMQRLSVSDASGGALGDRVALGTITVTSAP